MQYQRIRLTLSAPSARVTLSRPEGGNRIDLRLLQEIEDAAAVIAETPGIAVTMIDAEGPDFCLGWDREAQQALLDPARATIDPFAAVAALACPTVVAVRGRALSGGLELALACDIRIAAKSSRFGMPEVGEGLMPLGGASQRLPRTAGRAAALSLLLLGEEFDGHRALACGLVSRLAEDESLQEEARRVTDVIGSRGPLALRYAKEAAVRGADMALEKGLRLETDLSIILQSTADRAEGLKAFFEKRPPRFEGR